MHGVNTEVFILTVVTVILTQTKVVIATNSRTFDGPHRLVGTHKTADFTQTPRGHQTGCPPERLRGGESSGLYFQALARE